MRRFYALGEDNSKTIDKVFSVRIPGNNNIIHVETKALVEETKSGITKQEVTEYEEFKNMCFSNFTSASTAHTFVLLNNVITRDMETRLVAMKTVLIAVVIQFAIDKLGYAESKKEAETEYEREDANADNIMTIPLEDYLAQLKAAVNSWCDEDDFEGNSMGAKALVLSLIYLRRLKKSNKTLALDERNIRNLFLISVMLATKFLDDWVIPTKYWANLVSCDVQQVINMEATFCHQVGYNFNVTRRQIKNAVITLERRVF